MVVEEARKKVTAAKKVIQERRQEAIQATKALKEVAAKLPAATQERLRKKAKGLGGRLQRREIGKIQSTISGKQKEVEQFQEKLSTVEKEVLKFESQVSEVERQGAAIRAAKKAFEKGIPSSFVSGDEYKYLVQLEQNERQAKNVFSKQLKALEAQLPPGTKLILDPKQTKVIGLSTGKETLPIDAVINQEIRKPLSIKDKKLIRDLQSIPDTKISPLTGFSIVSAQSIPPETIQPVKKSVLQKIREKVQPIETKFDILRLKLAGVEPTKENLQKLDIAEKQFRKEVATPAIQLGAFALGAAPRAIASGLPLALAKTEVIGTIQRGPQGTKIILLGETTQTGSKPVFSTGTQFIRNVGDDVLGVGRGSTFQEDVVVRLPSTIRVNVKNIDPFLSVSRIEELGKGSLAKDFPGLVRVRAPIGEGSIIRSNIATRSGMQRDTTAIIGRTIEDVDEPFFSFIGGQPRMRINRRTGDISFVIREPNLRGTLFQVPAEEVVGPGVNILQPANIQKTPLSLTFREQKAVENLAATLKARGEKVLKPISDSSRDGTARVLSGSSVGVSGRESVRNLISDTDSISRGFSQTLTGRAVQKPIASAQTFSENVEKLGEEIGTIPKRRSGEISFEFSGQQDRQISLLGTIQEPIQKTPQREISFLGNIQTQPPIPRERERFTARQILRSILQVSQRPRGATTTTSTPGTPRTPTRTGPPPIIPLLKTAFGKTKGSKEKKMDELFKVFGRRFGEDVLLEEVATPGKAKTRLVKFLKGTLGRSGFVEFEGEKIDLGSFGPEFRTAKKDSKRIVQRRKFSLGTTGEKSEIQFFRKKKGGKSKRFKFL